MRLVASIAILYDRLRWEEKELIKAAEARGLRVKPVDAKSLTLLPAETCPPRWPRSSSSAA